MGGLTCHLTPPQDKRLSAESGLSEDSHLSTSTASQAEPEVLPAEAEALSQQDATLATQEEATEETYEEVRPALEATGLEVEATHPCPSPFPLPKQVCRWATPIWS